MTTFDLIVLIVLGYSVIQGFFKGLINQLAQIIAYIAGIYIAFHFSNWIASWINSTYEINSSYTYFIAFGIPFLGTMVLIFFLSSRLKHVLDILKIEFINRIGGILFSLIKNILLLSLVAMAIEKLDQHAFIVPTKERENSLTYKHLVHLGEKNFPTIKEKWISITPYIKEQLKPINPPKS